MTTYLNDLYSKLGSTYDAALLSGNLIFTTSDTQTTTETEYNIECEVCYAPALAKKPQGIPPVVEAKSHEHIERVNPFLPHDPTLFVEDASEHHKILLNKFCIVPHHFLIVTKDFRPQTQPLLPEDLLTAWNTLQALKDSHPDAIAFYNCGARSGASQPHKHLQVLPITRPTPLTNLVREVIQRRPGHRETRPGEQFTVPFPCVHHAVLLQDPENTPGMDAEDILVETYIKLMDNMLMSIREYAEQEHLSEEERDLVMGGGRASGLAYNWILTREFMMLVPRRLESTKPTKDGIALNINSLGFAGMVLAKTPEELEHVKKTGVIELIAETGFMFGKHGEGRSAEEEAQKKKEQEVLEKQMGGALSSL
ncbi:bifunctional AP-4-A phosphorylase/ADP sulfurylase [Mortierella hygrophila]|uniref:Bifunctional AP-4-A phosphorylase/ADP sulfurylase n=1 Tax=Mortierella hygrophila TaxID=979708 RepID=A0A9P6JXZ5_9FUNG|nr:bifunctional AP-4-A phosphorylase/ADP sulfurylase [Mortierella hygrophila]